jgi:cytoplasmic tRNA 2-thiolation protein 2
MLSLQKIAIDNGYNRIVLGSCTSKIACHVITSTIKGKGYSLAADIQYVDARWKIPVVLPLRDCLSQELDLLCQLDRLETVEVSTGPSAGINGLVSSFVKLLQEENASRECTIVRTAGKLTPFQFNRMPESDDNDVRLASQRRQKRFNLKPDESLVPPESFCTICNSPFNKSDDPNFSNPQIGIQEFAKSCCASCQFQILPKEQLKMEHFHSLLPQSIVDRSKNGSCCNQLREQIQDFLLFDDDDET